MTPPKKPSLNENTAKHRLCDHPDCPCAGDYRAPKHKNNLNDYYWFCLQHVREYNAAWDFLAGMSEEEIESYIRNATVWEMPTWPIGIQKQAENLIREKIRNGLFEESLHTFADPPVFANKADKDAFNVLGFSKPVDFPTLKARYKILVKKHHPDANAGSAASESLFKAISQAFSHLKKRLTD